MALPTKNISMVLNWNSWFTFINNHFNINLIINLIMWLFNFYLIWLIFNLGWVWKSTNLNWSSKDNVLMVLQAYKDHKLLLCLNLKANMFPPFSHLCNLFLFLHSLIIMLFCCQMWTITPWKLWIIIYFNCFCFQNTLNSHLLYLLLLGQMKKNRKRDREVLRLMI